MCGIFGVIAKKESLYSKSLLKHTVEKIAVLSESRCRDFFIYRKSDGETGKEETWRQGDFETRG